MEVLPYALAMGVSEEIFWTLNPRKFKIYKKAHNIRTKDMDEQMWIMGQYVMNATLVAIDRGLNGQKAKSKYIEKPLLHNMTVEVLREEERMKLELKRLEIQGKIIETNRKIAQKLKEQNNG